MTRKNFESETKKDEERVRQHWLSELFSKNMSDHSVGAYRELGEGVDKVFEAVPSTETMANALNSIVSVRKRNISAQKDTI